MKDSARQRLLTERFCGLYLLLGNGEEAAIRAGIPKEQAFDFANKMLHSKHCRNVLQRLSAAPAISVQTLVMNGLARLAFGRANDIARLVFADEMPSEQTVSQMDLFHVSEIKRVKGGGVEVKLFDRQKALERLLECANAADSADSANALLAAFAAPKEAYDDGNEPNADVTAVFSEAM